MKKYMTNKERREMIVKSWDKNLSIRENAEKLGISYAAAIACRRNFRLEAVTRKESLLKREMRGEVICYLREKGFSVRDIARLFKVSAQRISQIINY